METLQVLSSNLSRESTPVTMKDVRSWSSTTAGDLETGADDVEDFKDGNIYTIEEAGPK